MKSLISFFLLLGLSPLLAPCALRPEPSLASCALRPEPSLAPCALSPEPYFLSSPALSPDGKTVVFSFEGDLWKADLASGNADRLTAMQGYETSARISPDGKWIAFTGRQFGNGDVYLIPMEGGEIRQLTFHAANDEVENWNWDSKSIYFTSGRFNSGTVYKVPLDGGNPVRLFEHYFNTIHNLAENPKTGELFFNDTWESQNMASRKRYKGDYNPDIQSYNPKTGEYKKYTEWIGKDMWATIDQHGTVYFVSDEKNGEYNLCKLENGKTKNLTNFKTSIKRPIVSADGSKVIFEKDYQLYTYEPASDKTAKVTIRINRNSILPKEQNFSISGKISDFDVSPDNKKIAFISRGELFVSDIEGKYIKPMHLVETHRDASPSEVTPKQFERVMSVKWLNDNKTLLYNQTWNGYLNWFTLSADGSGKPKQLTTDKANNRDIVLNKDMTKAAYLSGRDELRLMDLKTMESKLLVKDEFWGFQNGEPGFSPDGEYVIYTAKRNFEDDIFVYHLKTGVVTNLTATGVAESGPVWSADGKYIYFSTNRTKPTYPTGGGASHIYRFSLDKIDAPFRTDEFEKLWKKEPALQKDQAAKKDSEPAKKDTESAKKDSTAVKKDSIAPITINTDRIWERFEMISPGFGSQGGPCLIQKGDKTIVLYYSDHAMGAGALWKTALSPWDPPKTEKIEGAAPGSIVKAGDKYYMLTGGVIYKLNVDGNKAEKIEMANFNFTRNLAAEFSQMFEETWANMEENYYHERLHGADWPAYKAYYQQFLPFLNSRNDLRVLMADMLGELNSSHQGFNSYGEEESGRLNYITLETGILYEESAPFTVKRLVTRSTADRSTIDIKPGDMLVKVNGEPVQAGTPRDVYFYRPAMEPEMLLTFKRKGVDFDVKIHPMAYNSLSRNLYDEWVDGNRQKVNELSKNRIAYAQMKDMGGGELENFLMTMTRDLENKDGLILDLRYNTGGNVHDDVLRFLSQRTYLQWKSRGGKLANQSNFAPSDKPIVLLINEQSLSDAEMTSAGFKALKLGTIIGTESYRWIIFTSAKGLVDGSSYRLPGWGCYTLDGQDLEATGVKPDIYLKNTFLDRLAGKDPQLSKAVEVIMRAEAR
ncbi:MAG: S41 family peptidase [Bacteroidales bacterium]|jgi:Tol biopolymer transport system component/C-terminal processing protease CtpA/Prc